MASYSLAVTLEDKRIMAEYFSGIIDSQRQTLKAICEDYFDGQKALKDGDEIDIKIKLSEPVVYRLGVFRLQRIKFDVNVSGIFGGEPFEYHKCIKRPLELTTRAARKKKRKLNKEFTPPTAEDDLEHERLIANLSETMFNGFEKGVGRSSSSIAIRWKTTKIVLGVLEILFVAFMIWTFFWSGFMDQASSGFRRFFMFGIVVCGFLLYSIGYVIGAAMMPLEFFEDHREGHRVMDFVKKDDPHETRNALWIGVAVLALIAVFMVFVYKRTFS